MKLKYYLRGLGVGIICTAIIMGIALSGQQKEKLTDAEIVERARLLGMIMEEESGSGKKEEEDQKVDQKKEKITDQKKEETEKEENQNEGQKDNPEKDQVQVSGEPEIKTIEILTGDYSDVVSRKLFEADLIPDAAAFNSYLTETGADREITVGVHKIPMGASHEEIIGFLREKAE